MNGTLRIILWALTGGVAAATLLGQLDRIDLGQGGWIFDLLAHWPKQLFLLGFGVAVFAGALKLWRLIAVTAVLAATNAALVLSAGNFVNPQQAPAGVALVRVVSANVHGSPEALARLIAMARDYGADLVSVYEAPEGLADTDLSALFPEMPTARLATRTPDGRKLSKRMLFAVRAKSVGQIAMMPFGASNGVILRFHLPVSDGFVRIVTTHPPSPGTPGEMADRNQQLSHLQDGLPQEEPFIVLGDFNTTPWARIFGVVPGQRAGDPRFDGSFPAFAGFLGLPIDHITFGGGLVLTDYRVGPDIGSDHRPLFATFALRAH